MLYTWKVTAPAVDEHDAAVVADVLEQTLLDERNDPDEPLLVTVQPASQLEAAAWRAANPASRP